jgi:hypothetical protein
MGQTELGRNLRPAQLTYVTVLGRGGVGANT